MNARSACSASVLALALTWPAAAFTQQEKHVENAFQNRVVLAFKANPTEVQRWLPAGWQSEPFAAGPSKDSNLAVFFVERTLDQDSAGKPAAMPPSHVIALIVPAKNAQSGESGPLIVRTYDNNPNGAPGFYKTGVPAIVTRELVLKSSHDGLGLGSDRWRMEDGKGGTLELHVQYQRGTPSISRQEVKPRSGIDPMTWRIYRQEQAVDVLKSAPAKIDRVKGYQLEVKVRELEKLFDGSEQLVSITSIPWYARQTLLPQH